MIDRRISIAPMMGCTDRHERFFLRRLTHHALLYTEMIAPGAILFGNRRRFLGFDPCEHPVALQLGDHDPSRLAACAALAEEWGFDEVNLNVGCPSERGTDRRFGACLMGEPETVAACVKAMQAATSLPVTVKTRVGIDRQDSYDLFRAFIDVVAEAGCRVFIVHARKAWLEGLSPKDNREVPPLRYEYVYRLKQELPELTVVINGGIRDWDSARVHLDHVDGVMIGREAYENPYFLTTLDRDFYGDDHPVLTREEALESFFPYVERNLAEGVPLFKMTRHLIGLYRNEPRARAWRRHLTEGSVPRQAGIEVLHQGLEIASGRFLSKSSRE